MSHQLSELHVHLEGTATLDLLRQLRKGEDYLFYQNDTLSWKDHLDVYSWFAQPQRKPEDFNTIFQHLLRQEIGLGVSYVEVRLDVQGNLRERSFLEDVLSIMKRTADQNRELIKAGVLLSLRRQDSLGQLEKDTTLCEETHKKGLICGVDFTGREYENPPKKYSSILTELNHLQIPWTYHIGEQSEEAELTDLLSFSPRRVSHNLKIRSREVIEEFKRVGVHTEICLTSNMMTDRWPLLSSHPVRLLLYHGCPISINSDDPTFFNTDVRKEYDLFVSEFGDARVEKIFSDTLKAGFIR